MPSTFGLTYLDIEILLQGYPLGDHASDIAALIEQEAAILWGALNQKGLVETSENEEEPLYDICRRYLSLRVAAEVGRSFTHQDPELSIVRDKRADAILESIRRMPEAFPRKFDNTKHGGTSRGVRLTRAPRSSRGSSYFGD